MTRPNLIDLTIEVMEIDDEVEITISAPYLLDEPNSYTGTQIMWSTWNALGTLGRLAAMLTEELRFAAHTDPRFDDHHTRVTTHGFTILDTGGPPMVTVTAPHGKTRLWLQRVTDTLALIRTQDREWGGQP